MSSSRERIPPRPKRQHTEVGLSADDPYESQPSKRLIKLHSAEFYDSLSKVWLTRRALKELDRRTSQASSPQQPVPLPLPRRVRQEDILKKQIQRFAKHGGPELCDLRGYPEPIDVNLAHVMSSSRCTRSSGSKRSQSIAPTSNPTSGSKQSRSIAPTSNPTSRTPTPGTSDKRSSAYDKDFEQHLIDYKVYPNNRKSKPEQSTGLYQTLAKRRPSLSPSRFSDNAFEDFQRKNDQVINEGEVMRDIIPIICGNTDIPNKQNLLFTRLSQIANNTIVDAQPDFYDGARLMDVDKRVREDIGNFIIPTGHPTAPVAPNFFLEFKAPRGAADVAKRQVCYDGALGARAMHSLQSYSEGGAVYDGNAYTITSTYYDGQLKMYTTHPTQSVDGTTEYHMTQVKAYALTSDPDSFRQGATAFRNARDWAQEQRDALISAANKRARSMNAGPS